MVIQGFKIPLILRPPNPCRHCNAIFVFFRRLVLGDHIFELIQGIFRPLKSWIVNVGLSP